MKVGVLVSGRGTNLRRLVEDGFEVAAVATNRPDCGAAAFAARCDIPVGVFQQKQFAGASSRDAAMRTWLEQHGVRAVVLAGWDRILDPVFTSGFGGRIINVHPSLLPAFGGGMDAVAQALAYGVKITGCTVHLVSDRVDAGPILLQAAVPVVAGDTVETLHARIQAEEHRILPAGLRMVIEGEPARAAVG